MLTRIAISLAGSVTDAFPDLEACFLLIPNAGYSDRAAAERAAKVVVDRARAAHGSADELRGSGADSCYRAFYRAMGLKAAQVSNPAKQAARVLENGTYRTIFRAIDIAMEIEYATLVSFQLYDAMATVGPLTFTLANGTEPIVTSRGEPRTCKAGELVLADEGGVMHSCYYGNHRDRMLSASTPWALVRIMGVPGLTAGRFDEACDEAKERLGAVAVARLDAAQPTGTIALTTGEEARR